jgi:6-phosphogluconate dehydrogenase
MPGGHPDAWPHIKKIFQSIAAQTDGQPCCDWVGEEGAGHYVKMVHNGIEYGDMQLICEVSNTLLLVWRLIVGLRSYETGLGVARSRYFRRLYSLE